MTIFLLVVKFILLMECTHYTNHENIEETDQEPDKILTYEEIIESYSQEQRWFVQYLNPLWATLLLTIHMPLFFQIIFFIILYVYFRFFNKKQCSVWAKKIIDPIYVTIPLIQFVWNLPGIWFYKLLQRKNNPIKECKKIEIPLEWILHSTPKPKNLPENVSCMLYSSKKIDKSKKILFSSIILHFHGGGFIASSPQGHESYLRKWTKETGFVIISVDYSLAPEFPFPCALNQCLSVFKFLQSNNAKDLLGFEYDKIIIAGDSAGGNMSTAVTLFSLTEQTIKPPAGVILVYPSLNRTPTLKTFSSEQLINDAVLPASFKRAYTFAYISKVWDKKNKKWNWKDDKTKEYYLSPLVVSSEIIKNFPQCYIICGRNDPLWYDTLIFYNKLCNASKNTVICDCIPGVSHGFLGAGANMPKTSAFAIEKTAYYISLFGK